MFNLAINIQAFVLGAVKIWLLIKHKLRLYTAIGSQGPAYIRCNPPAAQHLFVNLATFEAKMGISLIIF
jgi:hypothetical protein